MQRFESDVCRNYVANNISEYASFTNEHFNYYYCESTNMVTSTPRYMMLVWLAPVVYVSGASFALIQTAVPMLMPVVFVQPAPRVEQPTPSLSNGGSSFAMTQSPTDLRQPTQVMSHQSSVFWSPSTASMSSTPGSMQSSRGLDQNDLTSWDPTQGYRRPPSSLLQEGSFRATPSPQKLNYGLEMPNFD